MSVILPAHTIREGAILTDILLAFLRILQLNKPKSLQYTQTFVCMRSWNEHNISSISSQIRSTFVFLHRLFASAAASVHFDVFACRRRSVTFEIVHQGIGSL